MRDGAQSEQANGDEPQQHHRTKDVGNERRPFSLDQEQPNQDRKADRHDHRCKSRGIELQALYRA